MLPVYVLEHFVQHDVEFEPAVQVRGQQPVVLLNVHDQSFEALVVSSQGVEVVEDAVEHLVLVVLRSDELLEVGSRHNDNAVTAISMPLEPDVFAEGLDLVLIFESEQLVEEEVLVPLLLGEGGPEADAEGAFVVAVREEFGQLLQDLQDAEFAGLDDGVNGVHVVEFEGELEGGEDGLDLLHRHAGLLAQVAAYQVYQLLQHLHLAVLLELFYAY